MAKPHYSTAEAAEILGVSRIAIFKRIRSGSLRATKIGKGYVIAAGDLGLLHRDLNEKDRSRIRAVVRKVLSEYGDVIRKLGRE